MTNDLPSWAPWVQLIVNYWNYSNFLYHKLCYMATHYWIKKKNTLILNATTKYILSTKRFEDPLIYWLSLKSLNPSRTFLKYFIIFTSYPILWYFFSFLFILGILEYWCLVTVTFKFTVLYNNNYRKKMGTVARNGLIWKNVF